MYGHSDVVCISSALYFRYEPPLRGRLIKRITAHRAIRTTTMPEITIKAVSHTGRSIGTGCSSPGASGWKVGIGVSEGSTVKGGVGLTLGLGVCTVGVKVGPGVTV